MTQEELDNGWLNGPFNEQGWYEPVPGLWTPGKPACDALVQYRKDNPELMAEIAELRKKMRDIE